MKQTAIEWLYDKWSNCKEWKWEEIEQWFEQAKEMEEKKEYETKAYWFGRGILAGRENKIKELQPKK